MVSKNPSLLKKTSATMQTLSFEKVNIDLKSHCPLLYSVLMTAGTTQTNITDTNLWLLSVVVTASVVLK